MTRKQKILIGIAAPIMLWCFVMMVITFVKQSNPEKVASEAFQMLNELRVEYGHQAFVWDESLAEQAIKHSEWMNEYNLLEHSDLEYWEAIEHRPEGYAYDENVLNPWRDSPPHSAIIFSDEITYAAIGISGDYATFLGR